MSSCSYNRIISVFYIFPIWHKARDYISEPFRLKLKLMMSSGSESLERRWYIERRSESVRRAEKEPRTSAQPWLCALLWDQACGVHTFLTVARYMYVAFVISWAVNQLLIIILISNQLITLYTDSLIVINKYFLSPWMKIIQIHY